MSDGPRPGRLTAGPSAWRVWAIAFVYSATGALLIQLVILPHVFPAWHAGNGLLAGGDWVAFHAYAVRQAERIRAQGWGAFQLRPMTNAPIGIASAVYALTCPKPWTLIPLHAALHATGAAVLYYLLRGLVRDWRWAALGMGPFLLYPSAMTWVSQIHKDGFFIAGYFCLFAAWGDLARPEPPTRTWKAFARSTLLLLVGFSLIWVVRPDQLVVAQFAASVALGVLAVVTASRVARDRSRWRPGARVLALALVAVLAPAWIAPARVRFLDSRGTPLDQGKSRARSAPLVWSRGALPDPNVPTRGISEIPWHRTEGLPARVEHLAYRLALVREMYLVYFLSSRTNIDADVGFYRVTDVLRHVPRALQVALFAPFPTHWGRAGSLTWTSATRRLVAVEMLGVYAALAPLPIVAWRWRRRPDLWAVLLPCLAPLLLYALLIPNLGALYRFRYGFLMVLVGIGIAGGLELLARSRQPRPD